MQDIAEIKKIPFADVMTELPSPGDAEQLSVGLESWKEVTADDPALAEFAGRLESSDAGARLLASIFGNSPSLD